MSKFALLLLAVISICLTLAACTDVKKPTIGSVPNDWYISDQYPYGTFSEDDNTK